MAISRETSITVENIQVLVRTFYPTILKDETVGPFFIEKIGADIHSDAWEEHLELLSHFWAFVALDEMQYSGTPLAPHFHMQGISRMAFRRWLELFSEAVDRVYEEEAGRFFKERSANIAENFMQNLGL